MERNHTHSKFWYPERIALVAGYAVVAIGLIVLCGWQLQNQTMKHIMPGAVSMNPLTAFLLIISGSALCSVASKRIALDALIKPFALVVLAASLLRLCGYAWQWEFGIDRVLFANQLINDSEPFPNRMAPTSAFCFLCIGLALLLLRGKTSTGQWYVQGLASLAGLVALLALIGYLYGIRSLASLSPFIPMALHTSAAFILLSIGMILARPSGGFFTIQSRFVLKLYGSYLAIILLTTLIIAFLVDRQLQRQLTRDLQQQLQMTASFLVTIGEESVRDQTKYPDLKAIVKNSSELPMQLSLLNRDGIVVADSELDAAELAKRRGANNPKPEIQEAVAGTKALITRARSRDGRLFTYLALPVQSNGTTIGFARAGVSQDLVLYTVEQVRVQVLTGTVIGFLLAIVVGIFMARRLTRRIANIANSAEALMEGDLAQRIPAQGRDEIALLGGTFNRMTEKLAAQMTELHEAREFAENATESKGLFLSHMSHEIRTPLNGVIGMIHMLQRTDLNETQRRYVEVAKASGDTLLTLINNILDLSKLQAGKLEIELINFDIYEAVENAIEVVAYQASDKNLELISHVRPGVPQRLRGDPKRLQQILVNLVGNAIKFTNTGEILVRVYPESFDDDMTVLHFEVIDTGIGIPKEAFDKLFRLFSQVDSSTTRTFGGTGLGLAITKQLVDLLGGTVGVQSEVGRGTTFWFTLAFQALSGPKSQSVAFQSNPRRMKVLVIDDNESCRTLLTEHMTSWGMQTASCADLQTAQEIIDQRADNPFNAILIDKEIGAENGLEFGALLSRRPDMQQTIRIVMLSLGQEVPGQVLREKGFHGHILKPVRQSRLFDSIMDGVAALQQGGVISMPKQDGPAQQGARRGLRILLVEDNTANQIVAGEILGYLGHHVDVAGNGKLAVEAYAAQHYDLILMDCQMPVMDGFAATRKIREMEREKNGTETSATHIPIIALTANAGGGDRDLCLAAGMSEYCTKPIDPDVLAKIIRTLFPQQADDQLARPEAPRAPGAIELKENSRPFDPQALLQRVMRNQTAANEVLQQLERTIRESLEMIALKLAEGAGEEVANSAHALRGAASLVAANALSAIAKEIELAARGGLLDAAAMKLDFLRQEAEACLRYIPVAKDLFCEEKT